jgi:hypothetical protein
MGKLPKVIFRSYSLLASFFLAATFWLVYRHLDTTLTRLPVVVPQAFQATTAALVSGDIPSFLMRSMALFFLVAFPATALIGLTLYLARLARLCARPLARRAAKRSGAPLSRRLT